MNFHDKLQFWITKAYSLSNPGVIENVGWDNHTTLIDGIPNTLEQYSPSICDVQDNKLSENRPYEQRTTCLSWKVSDQICLSLPRNLTLINTLSEIPIMNTNMKGLKFSYDHIYVFRLIGIPIFGSLPSSSYFSNTANASTSLWVSGSCE